MGPLSFLRHILFMTSLCLWDLSPQKCLQCFKYRLLKTHHCPSLLTKPILRQTPSGKHPSGCWCVFSGQATRIKCTTSRYILYKILIYHFICILNIIYDDVHILYILYILFILSHISYVHFFIEVQKEVELLAAWELVVGGISRFGSLKFEGKGETLRIIGPSYRGGLDL